jgi:hypothetical protein
MKISVTQYENTITIEDPRGDEYTIDEFIEHLVVPLMCAMEYDHSSVLERLDVE